jgi:hypothetical protein
MNNSIEGKCKHCGKWMKINPSSTLRELLYCSDDCWVKDWLKNYTGLVHPNHTQTLSNHSKIYGKDKVIISELISKLEHIQG